MKNLKFWALCLISATLLFNACGSDDEDEREVCPPDISFRITEMKSKIHGEFKPLLSFTYDANNLLSKAVYQNWNSAYSLHEHEFIYNRGTNGEIINVTLKSNYIVYDNREEEWTRESVSEIIYTPVYTNGNIVKVSYNKNNEVYNTLYTWKDGKIKTVTYNNGRELNFTYTNGNYLGFYDERITTHDGKVTTEKVKDVYTYDESKSNFRNLIPFEYYIFHDLAEIHNIIDIDEIVEGIMSDNNLTVYDRLAHFYDIDVISGDTVGNEGIIELKKIFTYTYDNDGVITGYTSDHTSTVTWMNHSEEERMPPSVYKVTRDILITTERY